MGVFGAAQIGHELWIHCHTPSLHVTCRSHAGLQSVPSGLQLVPACGKTGGHAAAGDLQYHSGGSMTWQFGYAEPPWQELHQQCFPPEYQHESVSSLH